MKPILWFSVFAVVLSAILLQFVGKSPRDPSAYYCNELNSTIALCHIFENASMTEARIRQRQRMFEQILNNRESFGHDDIYGALENQDLIELEDLSLSTTSSSSSEYQFRLKGVPHIDPLCMPKRAHYYRSVDGRCNWPALNQSLVGSVGQPFGRDRAPHFADGINAPRNVAPRATPRRLSNAFWNASKEVVHEWQHTPYLVGFVEFLVHDILGSSHGREKGDTYRLQVPEDDTFFDNRTELWYTRTARAPGTGEGNVPRQNLNMRSVWLDLSTIYGRTEDVQHKLRSHEDGKLRLGKNGKMLPTNKDIPGVPVENRNKSVVFVSGDERVNQDILLQAYHTLYVLEHNYVCDELKERFPNGLSDGPWTDELLFLTARTLMSGLNNMVASAYFLSYFKPSMPKPVSPLSVFQQYMGGNIFTINPFQIYPWRRILSPEGTPFPLPLEFSVGYRWHDLLPGTVLLRDLSNQTVGVADVAKTSFSTETFDQYGVEAVLHGMSVTEIPHFHSGVSDQLRNVRWNFAEPQAKPDGGFDLVAWAIENERDRGLPTFNEYFAPGKYDGHVPIKPRKSFEEFTSDPRKVAILRNLYDSPDDVDLTVGQELDESWWPDTNIPTSVLALSFYTLARGTYNDRFSANWLLAACIVENKPWNCQPTNMFQEIFWRPVKNLPNWRWLDPYWLDRFDFANNGQHTLWSMIVRNTDIKCIQQNVFFKSSSTNPVVCYDQKQFPGPKRRRSSLDDLMIDMKLSAHADALEEYWKLTRKFGTVVSYSRGDLTSLLLNSAKVAGHALRSEEAFTSRPPNEFLSKAHKVLEAEGDSQSLYRRPTNDNVWKKLRPVIADFSSSKATVSLMPIIQRHAAALASSLTKTQNKSFDPHRVIQTWAINMMGEINFGSHYTPDSDVTEAFRTWLESGKSKDSIRDFFYSFQVSPSSSCWYSQIVQQGLSAEITAGSGFDVFAFSLNSAFAFEYSLFLLGVRPELQDQIYAEVSSMPVTVANLHRMPTLMTTLKELNRAYPASGGIIPRTVIEDTTLERRLIRKRTITITNALYIHHHDRHYEKPFSFLPQRWDEMWNTSSSVEEFMDNTRNSTWLTFGAGTKSCPANRFAMIVQAATIAEVVKSCRFHYTPKFAPAVRPKFGAETTSVRIKTEKR